MKNLYEPATAGEIRQRIQSLRADSTRQWGKMNPAQAAAHCAKAMEMAVGDAQPPRMFLGRLFGGMVMRRVVADDSPLKKQTPTAPTLVTTDQRDMDTERAKLAALVDRFAAAGPAGCTSHPHTFFGPMTPEEWSVLMYKHIDHHLRQFAA